MAASSNLLTKELFLLTIWANVLTFRNSCISSFRKIEVEKVVVKMYLWDH